MDRLNELKRLVELRQDVREFIGDGRTEALEDFRSACIRFDFSWAVAEIERLRESVVNLKAERLLLMNRIRKETTDA